MALHVITQVTVDANGHMIGFTIAGVVWSRKRVWINAKAGDTFETVGPTALGVSFPKGFADPSLIASSDVTASAVKDTLTGVPQVQATGSAAAKGA